MKTAVFKLSLLSLALCSGAVLAQQRVDFGKREFESNCASCHGMDGKGNPAMGAPHLT
ncbi:MAG: c-type cytochrome [Hylemonella sp.]